MLSKLNLNFIFKRVEELNFATIELHIQLFGAELHFVMTIKREYNKIHYIWCINKAFMESSSSGMIKTQQKKSKGHKKK